jgi:RNA-binding protein YhbY
MTNGDVQVIVAPLLMGQRARRIEVCLRVRAERGHKVAGVIGAVVVVYRRIIDHQ